jgi:hypothetical protein
MTGAATGPPTSRRPAALVELDLDDPAWRDFGRSEAGQALCRYAA